MTLRVLHVIDPGSPGGGACTLQLLSEPLARLNTVHQDVLLIGTNRHEALAKRCGVEVTGRIAPPRNEPILAGVGGADFKRVVNAYESAGGRYDIIHTWTARSTLLAALAAPQHRRLATLAVGPVNALLVRALARLLERRPTILLATSVAVKRDYVAMGIGEEQVDILRPAVHPEAVEAQAADRDTLRERWGVEEDVFVVGLFAEPVSWCDARRAISVIGLARESGRNVRLLVHPKAQRRQDAMRWARRLGMRELIITEDDLAEPWTCLHGVDAALLLGDDTMTTDLSETGSPFAILTGGGRGLRPMFGVMPALWAMGAGVPVIAERTMALQEIIADDETGLLVDHRDVAAAADRLVRLYDDRDHAMRIATAARAHVHRKYHVSAYCVRLRDLYERIEHGRLVRVVDDANAPVVEQRRGEPLRM